MNDEMRRHCFFHARQRAMERYGFHLTLMDWDAINAIIVRGNRGPAKFIAADSKSRVVYRVPFAGKSFLVAYSKTQHCVVTFLPPQHWAKSRRPDRSIQVYRREGGA